MPLPCDRHQGVPSIERRKATALGLKAQELLVARSKAARIWSMAWTCP